MPCRLLRYFLLLLLLPAAAKAQVEVSGIVRDAELGAPLPYSFVIIHRTGNGVFCDTGGKFKITTRPNDSLLVSLTGYNMQTVILSDSVPKQAYKLNIRLKPKPVQIREFQVKAPKTFDEILKELEVAERSKVSHQVPVSSAIESPITFLYMQFSKEGKAIRKISELKAEDAKQELLRDLFTRYMLAHIIDLDEADMDDFIAFSGLKQTYNLFDTEYDLVVYVKKRFNDYRRYRGLE
ncbi:MAG: carboxypeptidase-like regulatory domain-containing protein [Bacteroidia bacterium]